jgi:hypothetical protein
MIPSFDSVCPDLLKTGLGAHQETSFSLLSLLLGASADALAALSKAAQLNW